MGDLKWLLKSHVMHLIRRAVPIANIWAWLSEGGTQILASRHFCHYYEGKDALRYIISKMEFSLCGMIE